MESPIRRRCLVAVCLMVPFASATAQSVPDAYVARQDSLVTNAWQRGFSLGAAWPAGRLAKDHSTGFTGALWLSLVEPRLRVAPRFELAYTEIDRKESATGPGAQVRWLGFNIGGMWVLHPPIGFALPFVDASVGVYGGHTWFRKTTATDSPDWAGFDNCWFGHPRSCKIGGLAGFGTFLRGPKIPVTESFVPLLIETRIQVIGRRVTFPISAGVHF